MGVLVAVLNEDVLDGLDIRNAKNVMVLREKIRNTRGGALGEDIRTPHAPLILKTEPRFEIHSFH